jgi:exonuclease III
MDDTLSLNVASFNCRGYNDGKRNYTQSLLAQVSVLFIQETWLSDSQTTELGRIDDKFVCTGRSGFDDSDVLTGRPYGGVAILWRSDLSANVTVINTNSRRVCAVRMDSDKLLFINVYMPFESDDQSTDEFVDQLTAIEDICSINSDCHVIAGGDYNVDFTCERRQTAVLNDFCESTGLNPVVRHHKCNIDYTYSFKLSRFSVLDHFLLSGSLYENSVNSAFVLHEIDNLSDHEPIVLELSLETKHIGLCQRIHAPRVSWAKATDINRSNYRRVLSYLLNDISLPVDTLLCADLRCHDASHLSALNTYARALPTSA